jgi:hypothetical protein
MNFFRLLADKFSPPASLSSPEEEGYNARLTSKGSNPYAPGTKEAAEWEHGYDDAESRLAW